MQYLEGILRIGCQQKCTLEISNSKQEFETNSPCTFCPVCPVWIFNRALHKLTISICFMVNCIAILRLDYFFVAGKEKGIEKAK